MPMQRYEVGATTNVVNRKTDAGNEHNWVVSLRTGDNSKFWSGSMSADSPAALLVIFWVVPIVNFSS